MFTALTNPKRGEGDEIANFEREKQNKFEF